MTRTGAERVFLHVETPGLTSCSWLLIWSIVCRSSSSLAMMASILSASSRDASCSALLLSSSSLTALSSCSRSSAGHRRNFDHTFLHTFKALLTVRAPLLRSECCCVCVLGDIKYHLRILTKMLHFKTSRGCSCTATDWLCSSC